MSFKLVEGGMGFKTQQKILSWSPSRLGDYETCPRKAFYKHVERRPDPGGAAGNRGIELHKVAEEVVTAKRDEIPHELRKVSAFLNYYRMRHAEGLVKTEEKIGFRKDWSPCGFFDKEVWLRIVIDIQDRISEEHTEIVDWKSGKLKKEHKPYAEQLNLYSVCELSRGQGRVKKATSKLIFMDHGIDVDKKEGRLTLDVLQEHQKKWENRVEQMFLDDTFAMNPARHCDWCPYAKIVGGPCEF